MTMGLAVMSINKGLIAQLLRFEKVATVHGIVPATDANLRDGVIVLLLESDIFPEHEPGEPLVEVNAVYRTVKGGFAEFQHFGCPNAKKMTEGTR